MAIPPASIPKNVPSQPHEQTTAKILSKLNNLSSHIRKRSSRAWTSFQERSLANDERYSLRDILSTQKKRNSVLQAASPKRLEQSTPYPDDNPLPSPSIQQLYAYESPSWRPPEALQSLPSMTPPLSCSVHVMPCQPGHRPVVQSPYYLQVHLPDSRTASIQQQQHGYNAQDGNLHLLSPPNYVCCPYRPYSTTLPTGSYPGVTSSREL